jgi:hypothetical protein
MARMNQAQQSGPEQFTPWKDFAGRSCRTCAYAPGYDSVHTSCERFRLVVIDACGCWNRGARCDNLLMLATEQR